MNGSSKKPFTRGKKIAFGIVAFLLVALIAVLGIAYVALYLPAMSIKASATEVMNEAKLLKADIKENDIDVLKKRFTTVSDKYKNLEGEAEKLYWATFIPYVGDLKLGIEAGRYTIEAGKEAVEAIYPYADLIGFKQGEQSFSEKSAEDRLQTAVLTLDKMLARIDVVAKNIQEAEKRLEQIDTSKYPEKVGSMEVRSLVTDLKSQFHAAATVFVDSQPLLKQLPSILGAEEEKNYLILFQNTAERRATGGFYTFFAVFNINKGRLTIKDSSDIYDLDNSIPNHPAAPDKIKKYHINVSKFYIRDSNLSPDFVESIKLFDSLYQKAQRKVEYDGIIAMDSKVLVDLLRIFGDTQANGINFSAEIDKRCDCPQVIYSLFDIVDRPVNYVKVDRKRILGNLMLGLFNKVIGFSPSQYWGPMAEAMFQDLDQKHILLYFPDKKNQAAVETLNYAGRIQQVEGDFLHYNGVNYAGAKSNLFVEEEVISETMFEGDQIKRTVKIKFKNPYAHSDCNTNKEVAGLCLNATLRNWIRFYVPEGSKLISFKGSAKETLVYDELGKTVFEGFNTVNPKGAAEVTIEYTLPKSITQSNYSLYVQKQPGVEKQKLSVSVGGKERFKGPFSVDFSLSDTK